MNTLYLHYVFHPKFSKNYFIQKFQNVGVGFQIIKKEAKSSSESSKNVSVHKMHRADIRLEGATVGKTTFYSLPYTGGS